MNLKIFCVYDCKSESWGTPLFYDCRANAIRSLTECVNQPAGENQNQLAKYPADFAFFEIGEFDKLDGVLHVYECKVNLGVCIEYKETAKV